ncbi:alpha-galactosidase [Alteromonas sp. ASW11-36]|uniref:Alpha-galactosidase n=1 Tax=Alteromonas arenosi TaxID=3055817 RepID=A0ABT7SSV6_9ALTE|nr:alpha-galactosidase [Alteromonas sp. ASW11-36]MDM7859236.1 alpha-galactosidase [Alteromonas sp. ASW11-36]
MPQLPDFVRITSLHTTIVLDCRRRVPAVCYFGKVLSAKTSDRMLADLLTRQEAKCALVEEVVLGLTPTLGDGFTGNPGLNVDDGAIAWSTAPKLVAVEQPNSAEVTFISVDETRNIELRHHLHLCTSSDVLSATSTIINLGSKPLCVDDLAAPTIALPDHLTKIMAFEGRWSAEFQTRTIDLFLGAYARANRRGKTSHDNFPGVVLHTPSTSQDSGECYGFHLAWSGNHRTRVELLPEQRTYVQMGELLGRREVVLQNGEHYQSPSLHVSYSAEGLNRMSQQFHRFVRKHLLKSQVHDKPRPIHYNTWEGIYFDHNVDELKTLADLAANAGAERFVLDDGWFKGRRNDKAGLGDWTVDVNVYPNGLAPIIEHVLNKGMAFGIWFEPEMVNPDSDLYRNHPEWVLQTAGNPQINFRHQYVLDLTRQEVCDYLFAQIDAVLNEHPQISYIKWDMNRDINHSGNQHGVSAIHAQTKAVYALIQRVKDAHPTVEIESCSSGGARIDFGILAHTDRFWTSDSNDALDRLQIQRGCSYFIPPVLMGSHVGPRDCHITGRHLPIETRIAVAMFGHMGMEMDPRELTPEETELLQAGFALHRDNRELIHQGELYRIDENGDSIDFGVVAADKSAALFAYNSIIETKRTQPRKFRFSGLDPDAEYQLDLAWPPKLFEYSPSILQVFPGQTYSGEILMQMGMQLPVVFPQTSLIFKLQRV